MPFLRIHLVVVAAAVLSALLQQAHGDDTSIEFFERKIRPILVKNCFKCHSSKKQKGGLRLDSRAFMIKGGESGPAVVPGKPKQGELIAAINYDADGYQMPPTGKLKAAEIAALTEWVKMGAPWPSTTAVNPSSTEAGGIDLASRAKHWSFQPVQKQIPPVVQHSQWPRNSIDNFILAKLNSAGLSPSPSANKRTLLRRVTYDLIGLPPTSDEIAAFVKDDSPAAYEKVVNRLLASPNYGERWARHWLDLVRFAETAGHEFDFEIRHAWTYRDYVIRAFNDDVPYNQFVVEHIAGDLLKQPRRHPLIQLNESVIGTAFYWFSQGKHSPVDIRAEECELFDNQIDVLSKTFLGLTVACARCHDHKFDPITTKDYYALAGYLQSSRQQYAIIDPPGQTDEIVEQITTLKKNNRKQLLVFSSSRIQSELTEFAEALLAAGNQADAKPVAEKSKKVASKKQVTADNQKPSWREYLQKTALKNIIDPFHAWAVLSKFATGDAFNKRRMALVNQLRNQQKSANSISDQTMIFSDFDNFSFEDWLVDGPAFGSRPAQQGELVLQPEVDRPIRQVVDTTSAHSGLVSGRLVGAIRSQTFEIKKRYIWYRVKREGGKPNPGLKLKNGQVHLIIDGFQFIRNPLYGQLTINIPQGSEFKWYRQDLSKFIGHKAYIELEDSDDGFLVVDRILFSDVGPPPAAPNSLITEMLDDPAITSPKSLAQRYQQLLTNTAKRWASGEVNGSTRQTDSTNADILQLVNWLISSGLLDDDRRPARGNDPAIQTIVQKYRTLDTSIKPLTLTLATVDGTAEDEHVLIRGNHKKPGELVERRFLEVMGGASHQSPQKGSGRLELALQIADPTNPFTSRVIVNRLWMHHFGRGIVPTPDNFGILGQPPTHPELLDYLATELIRQKWSLKQMHRLMVTSNTYRMSSIPSPSAEKFDPDNILWHRMPVQRLEGEIIRDAILAVSGRLDRRMSGESVMPFLSSFMEGRGRPRQSGPLDGNGRRSIYINVRRNFLTPMFLAFDMPTPLTTMGRRSSSNVPAQALTMMNNPFIVQQARVWADRVLAESQKSRQQRIARLYEMAFGREPNAEETRAAVEFLEEQGNEYNGPNDPRTWTDLCHVLLNVKEFIFVN